MLEGGRGRRRHVAELRSTALAFKHAACCYGWWCTGGWSNHSKDSCGWCNLHHVACMHMSCSRQDQPHSRLSKPRTPLNKYHSCGPHVRATQASALTLHCTNSLLCQCMHTPYPLCGQWCVSHVYICSAKLSAATCNEELKYIHCTRIFPTPIAQ